MVDNPGVTFIGTISPSAVAAPPRSEAAPSVLHRNLEALTARGIALPDTAIGAASMTDVSPSRPPAQAGPGRGAWAGPGGSGPGSDPMKPLVVAGIVPLERTIALVRAAPVQADGFARRFVLVHEDTGALLEDLARTDASALFADPRVELFVGPGCLQRLRDWLHDETRQHTALPVQTVSASVPPPTLDAEARNVLAQAEQTQASLHQALRTRVLSAYAGGTQAHWARRFTDGTPLRVLIPVSRYSTFVRHSASDLAAALTHAGHEARVLTEPDDHSRLTTPAYLHAFDSFRPDVVVLINYTRRHMAQAIPPGVPVVCWIQDRMPQLFDAAVGASQGELDFVMGHLHAELFSQFQYPRTRRAFSFVPACPRRFRPPAEPLKGQSDEVGYVSHQSETPERFHARMKPMFASSPPVAAALDQLFTAAALWIEAGEANPFNQVFDRGAMVREALAAVGVRSPDERLVLTVAANYLVPLVERMTRHRTLEWAARLCGKLGLRLRLFGRGWESHPTLSAHAAGELAHDERALPDAYHRCLAHLHVSINTNAHQRVYECVLSGGLMLRRGPSPDAPLTRTLLMRAAAMKPPVWIIPEGIPMYECSDADGVDPAAYCALRGAPIVIADSGPAKGRPIYRRALTDAQRKSVTEDTPDYPYAAMPDVGFPNARETLFHTQAELEEMLTRAAREPHWRERVVSAQRACAIEHCTYDRFTSDMLALLRTSLAAAGS